MLNPQQGVSNSYHLDIEAYRGRTDPEAVKAVVKEMEALFAYELIKVMRESADKSSQDGGIGKDTYMSLFDMELAKLFAERGLGLQDMLLKGLNREIQRDGQSAAGGQQPEEKNSGQGSLRPAHDPQLGTINSGERKEPVLFSLPVDGRVSSYFGVRKHPIDSEYRFHPGVDIAAPAGTEIYPVRDGYVVFSGEQSGYGNVIIVDHGDGFITKYAHNKVNLVKKGENVTTSTVIAHVGSTGISTGPHLHFEVMFNGERIDPMMLIARK